MMDNVHNNTVIQKLELENSKLETGFSLLTSEAARSNYITGLAPGPMSDVCPLLVSPRNCPAGPGLLWPGDTDRC